MPEIRERMHALARHLHFNLGLTKEATELHHLARETKRRSAVRKASAKHVTTKEKIRAARFLAVTNPDMPYREIGRIVGLDGGRVSEAVAGFRD